MTGLMIFLAGCFGGFFGMILMGLMTASSQKDRCEECYYKDFLGYLLNNEIEPNELDAYIRRYHSKSNTTNEEVNGRNSR